MTPSHEELQALAPGSVLDILDADERHLFETHVKECSACAAEVESLTAAVHMLARAVPPERRPPAALREHLIAAVRNAAPASPEPAAVPRRPSERRLWLPVAASVVIALGAGIYGSHIHVETRLAALSERAELADREIAAARREAVDARSAMEILAAPDVVRIDLKGQGIAAMASGRALWSRQRGMVFSASNLPQPPPDRCYQIWLTTAGAFVSAGVLSDFGGEFAVLAKAGDASQPSGVAVTLEADGGVPAPTGPPLLVGSAPGL